MTTFEEQAATLEAAAERLELAARHVRLAAQHFRDRDVPRGCAHTFAAEGLMLEARQRIDEAAVRHAAKARVE